MTNPTIPDAQTKIAVALYTAIHELASAVFAHEEGLTLALAWVLADVADDTDLFTKPELVALVEVLRVAANGDTADEDEDEDGEDEVLPAEVDAEDHSPDRAE